MNIQEIYKLYEDDDKIYLEELDLNENKSFSTMSNKGICFVAIKKDKDMSEKEKLTYLSHELGHCKKGAFYNRYSPLSDIKQQECRAWDWATTNVIPFDELQSAFENGIVEIWELSEHFNVTEEFIYKTLEAYKRKGLYREPICEE